MSPGEGTCNTDHHSCMVMSCWKALVVHFVGTQAGISLQSDGAACIVVDELGDNFVCRELLGCRVGKSGYR